MDLELFEGIKIKEIDESQDGDFIFVPEDVSEDEENLENLGSQNMNYDTNIESEKEKLGNELVYEEIDKIIQTSNSIENPVKEEIVDNLLETQVFQFENNVVSDEPSSITDLPSESEDTENVHPDEIAKFLEDTKPEKIVSIKAENDDLDISDTDSQKTLLFQNCKKFIIYKTFWIHNYF